MQSEKYIDSEPNWPNLGLLLHPIHTTHLTGYSVVSCPDRFFFLCGGGEKKGLVDLQ